MAETVTGLALVSAASSEPQSIPGVPGLWSTDAELSVVPADHGFSVDDFRALAEEAGFEVVEVEWEREIEAAEDESGEALKADEIKAAIAAGEYDEDGLRALLDDDRSTVVKAAQKALDALAGGEPVESETEPEA